MVPKPPCWSLSTKKRIQLVVAYDGTDFCGWAPQRGQRTVHSTLTDAVRQISGEASEIIGASRTDSGAHARGQVCHFDTENPMPPANWTRALNDLLPVDVAIRASKKVEAEFHSRFWADTRAYRYRLRRVPRHPLETRFVHEVVKPLDLDAMQQAAAHLVGSHDFWSFSEQVPLEKNPRRELFSVQVRQVGPETWIDIVGNAFMRGMMRRISGGLYEVGIQRKTPDEIHRLLDPNQRDSVERPPVLPAKGLCLMRITYGRHPKDLRTKYPGHKPNDETNEEDNDE